MLQRQPIVWIHLLFAVSGAAGLGLQLTWTRRLAFGLGHEIPATYGVITVFFLGLAAGAWLIDRFWPRRIAPLAACAGLEFLIAAWALVSIVLIPALTDLTLREVSATVGWKKHWLISFIAPALALLPATLAMGATLPALERWCSDMKRDGLRVGPLYAANTFGAVFGVIAAVAWVQPTLGFSKATAVFAAGNAIAAMGCLLVHRVLAKAHPTRSTTPENYTLSNLSLTRLRTTLFFTGLLGIGFEVLGLRLLGQALENTVYTYAAVLAVYLLGTAVGAAVRNRFFAGRAEAVHGWFIALPCAFFASSWFLRMAPAWHPALRAKLGDGPLAVVTSEAVMAAGVFFIPTVLMGALFSTLVQLARDHRGNSGDAIAWNTLGGCLAPPLVGLALLPNIGSRWTLAVLAIGYLGLLPSFRGAIRAALAVVVVLFALPPWTLHLQRVPQGGSLLTVKEGPGDTIAVVEYADKSRALRANNRFTMGGTASASAERRHSHIPLLLHPKPKKALFLGVGTGISFAALDKHPGLEADGVELVPEIVQVLESFTPDNEFGNELTVRVADARRFVRSSANHYDVIVADLFHPARDGAGSLYTREQFKAIQTRLKTNGVFCQWLPLFQLDTPTLQSITRTFLDVFPHTEAFLLRFNADTPVLGLVGSRQALQFDSAYFDRRTQDPRLREQLKPLVLSDPFHFFGTWFADAAWLKQYSKGAPINTDDKPVVLFGAPRTLTGKPIPGHALLLSLLEQPRPSPKHLFTPETREAASGWLERLSNYQAARDVYLKGLIADTLHRDTEAEIAFVESARLSADFTSGYSQILSRASAQAKSNPARAAKLLDQLIDVRPERPIARELKQRLRL